LWSDYDFSEVSIGPYLQKYILFLYIGFPRGSEGRGAQVWQQVKDILIVKIVLNGYNKYGAGLKFF